MVRWLDLRESGMYPYKYLFFKLNHTLFTKSHLEIKEKYNAAVILRCISPLLCPGVGGDEVVEDHQQEQGHAQKVCEQSQLDVGNHYEV